MVENLKKRLKKKLKQKQEIMYLEYLYEDEREHNWELTVLLEKCLPFIPNNKLKETIESVVASANV